VLFKLTRSLKPHGKVPDTCEDISNWFLPSASTAYVPENGHRALPPLDPPSPPRPPIIEWLGGILSGGCQKSGKASGAISSGFIPWK
jgi:hypothetical protein